MATGRAFLGLRCIRVDRGLRKPSSAMRGTGVNTGSAGGGGAGAGTSGAGGAGGSSGGGGNSGGGGASGEDGETSASADSAAFAACPGNMAFRVFFLTGGGPAGIVLACAGVKVFAEAGVKDALAGTDAIA